jgi:arsenite methyltransferase
MSDEFSFDSKASKNLERLYSTPEVIAQRRAVLEVLDLRAGERVLDVGCGPGMLVEELARAVGPMGHVAGIDVSESALSLARERCAILPWVEFRASSALQIDHPDASFDAAVSTQVFEYVSDVDLALAELHRILRPGGRCLILDTDWRTVLWHSNRPERMARVLSAWEEHLVDPVLPRTLAARFRRARFTMLDQRVIPYLNTEYNSNAFSFGISKMIRAFVPGRHSVTEEEAQAWIEEFQQLADSGEYLFCLNRHAFLAEKP